MYTLATRMSDALAERPELRTVLPAFHPAFSKLNHPLLGKVLPRLVTVADAAKVAGVDANALLAVMNLPGPPSQPPTPSARVTEPEPAWLSGAPVTQLDARPVIEAGEEPFAAIMGAVRGLPTGAVLTVLTPFEPAPLRRILEDRGWRSHVAWHGETCRTSFWRPPELHARTDAASASERLAHTPHGWVLDVRGLEPPEPLRLALAWLDRGELPLTLLHSREPALLYPRLTERGLSWTVTTRDDHVEVQIHGP